MRVLTWAYVFGPYPVARPEAGVYDRIMHSRSEVSGYFGSIPERAQRAWHRPGATGFGCSTPVFGVKSSGYFHYHSVDAVSIR